MNKHNTLVRDLPQRVHISQVNINRDNGGISRG